MLKLCREGGVDPGFWDTEERRVFDLPESGNAEFSSYTICGRTQQSVFTDQMSLVPPLELCNDSEVN